jgi:hypothetical protein
MGGRLKDVSLGARGSAGDRPDVGEHAAGVPGWEGSYQRRGAIQLDAALADGLGPGEWGYRSWRPNFPSQVEKLWPTPIVLLPESRSSPVAGGIGPAAIIFPYRC